MSEYENGCPILEDAVILDHESICPRCGLICGSLTEYHKHFKGSVLIWFLGLLLVCVAPTTARAELSTITQQTEGSEVWSLSRYRLVMDFRVLFDDFCKLSFHDAQLAAVVTNSKNPDSCCRDYSQNEINENLRPLTYTLLGWLFVFLGAAGIGLAQYALIMRIGSWDWRLRVGLGIPALIVGVFCVVHACQLWGIN